MKLAIHKLHKAFGGNVVIQDLTLQVGSGEVLSLVGPNGAGKTTVFNLITGFLDADRGEILYDDRAITRLKPHEIKKLGVVRTFQNLRLFNGMSVLENMLVSVERSFGLKRVGAAELERADAALRRVKLHQRRDETAGELSYAEKKFLSLGRVIATGATCFLLDEPASGLDGPSLDLFHNIVRGLRDDGNAILLIEHNLDIVREISDRIAFLDGGTVVTTGTPEEIFANPDISERYFGVAVGGDR